MSARLRWLLAVIGLIIICLALAGLVYAFWPLADTQDRFTVPFELMILQFGRLGVTGG